VFEETPEERGQGVGDQVPFIVEHKLLSPASVAAV
jgi:hypothetical protein